MLRSRPGVARLPSRSRGSCRAWRCAAASTLSHFFSSASGARRCGTKSRPTKRDTSSSACANTYSLPRARDLAIEHARAGQLLGVGDKPRLEARERLELLVDEQLVGGVDPLRAR